MKKFKITQAEADILKQCAQAESRSGGSGLSLGNIWLEPGIRINVDKPEDFEVSMNILLCTDDPDWEGTDLYDFASWKDFRAGVPLTDDGRAEVDFYVRSKRVHPSGDMLFGNVQCIVENGEMVRVGSTGGVRWTKEGRFQ
jgi:hypothetical protein